MLHSSGMILLLRNVSTPPGTGNFNILQAVDATDWILLTPGLPIIPLYGDSDLTTAKSIQTEVEYSSSPIFTSSDNCPIGHIISPLKPMRGVVARTIWFFTSLLSLMKKCSYNIFEADPSSTYMRCTKWPPIFASITIGPFIPSSSAKGGNKISGSEEKLYVILCLAIFATAFNEFWVGDSVHESEDFYAFWGSSYMPTLSLEPFHKVFRRFSFSLFDVVYFYWIFDTFLLLKVVKPYPVGSNECRIEHMAP
ncbi:hypothetical protein Tco_0719444, partial [Tanacetum coccineum]